MIYSVLELDIRLTMFALFSCGLLQATFAIHRPSSGSLYIFQSSCFRLFCGYNALSALSMYLACTEIQRRWLVER